MFSPLFVRALKATKGLFARIYLSHFESFNFALAYNSTSFLQVQREVAEDQEGLTVNLELEADVRVSEWPFVL